ncbi:MAG: DUF3857 domain-containing protein [Cyclobacteriaceae bacterium]|nr:DUF3857 domain-containing protein [Cyclobacteriaceae bacterium]MCW5903153.1 DUF3857 domain-containing protein [Cyclobacteriaceae bacterium]
MVRSKEERFDIKSRSSATLYSFEAITILNPKGRSHARKTIPYDQLTRIVLLSASVYDENGKLIRKLKSSDFEDRSAISGYTLYQDNRMKTADLSTANYPYTIELEYELEYKFLFYIPAFYPIWDEAMSAQRAKYTIGFTEGTKPRVMLRQFNQKDFQFTEGLGSMSWSFVNIGAFKREASGPPWKELLPAIVAAPSNFEYDGYAGNMSSWENFGAWINQLNNGRGNLSNETIQKVKSLTKGLTTIEDKCRVLYQYLQGKTRYVSIQLGIGGFQPFEAKVVDEVGYGDCKALSNYMVALLSEAGVYSNYTLIRAGRDAPPIDHSFPSTQFNHVLVSVPNGADTLWLECTSQSNPFKYLGYFTDNRKALAISENGSKIVETPENEEEDYLIRKLKVSIDKEGHALIDAHNTYSGHQYERDNLNFINNTDKDAQKKWIEQSITIPSFRMENFNFENLSPGKPKVVMDYSLSADRVASISGKRLFLAPNLLGKMPIKYSSPEDRKTDVLVQESIVEYDTIEFSMPEGFYPEFIPEMKSYSNQFGEYKVEYAFSEGRLVYYRKFVLNRGRYGKDKYAALCAFNKEVSRSDNTKIVLLNKT